MASRARPGSTPTTHAPVPIASLSDCDILIAHLIEPYCFYDMKALGSKLIGVVSLVCFLIIAVTISIPLYISLSRIPIPPAPSYASDSDIVRTIEYQVMLRPFSTWANRTIMLNKWMNAINEYSNFIITNETGAEHVYAASHITIGGSRACYASKYAALRVREYISGSKRGEVNVDVKESGYYHEVNEFPFWPAEHYMNTSRQKLEKDIHACVRKYSRVSRVRFFEPPGIETCEDLANIFPGMLYKCPPNKLKRKVTFTATKYVWRKVWSGVHNNTKWDMTFELNYRSNVLAARRGFLAPYYGEWSVRVEAVKGTTFDPEFLAHVEEMYFKLTAHFDSDKKHVACANAYLAGDHVSYGVGAFGAEDG